MKSRFLLVDKEILPECYLKVMEAKELLLTGSYSIEEIAVAVGFANASYFCKVFKNITHITPSEFANKCKTLG